MSLTGAMTPAGLGMSSLIPLMEAGFVDWIISTGANLYHDAHFALGLAMHQGHPTCRRRRAARQGASCGSTTSFSTTRVLPLHRRIRARSVGSGGVPALR